MPRESNEVRRLRKRLCAWLESADFAPQPGLELVEGFVDALRSQIEVIREQQWEVAWRDFVYRSFGANPPTPQARQCQLVLALGGQGGFVPIDKLPALSPQLAAVYARRSSRVVYRDVAELLRRGLVERTPAGVRAKKELILAFLPWRKRA